MIASADQLGMFVIRKRSGSGAQRKKRFHGTPSLAHHSVALRMRGLKMAHASDRGVFRYHLQGMPSLALSTMSTLLEGFDGRIVS